MQNETMTKAEREQKFDGEWVLIGDPSDDNAHQLAVGTVLAHSEDRNEIHEATMKLRPTRSAFFYFGKTPRPIWINFGLLHHE